MKKGTRIQDSEGNNFIITDMDDISATLRGEAGEKEICVSDLKFYKAA